MKIANGTATVAVAEGKNIAPADIEQQLRAAYEGKSYSEIIRLAEGRFTDQQTRALTRPIPILIEMLQNGPSHLREAVALFIGMLGPRAGQYLEHLGNALSDPNEYVREEVLRTLGKLGMHARNKVAAISACLADDQNEFVKEAAASALGSIGIPSPEVLSALGAALSNPNLFVQEAAALAILKLQTQDSPEFCREQLLRASRSASLTVRRCVIEVLGKFPEADLEIVDALIRGLADHDETRWPAATAIARLGITDNKAMSALRREIARCTEPALRQHLSSKYNQLIGR